jgi:glycosyltransferase involved in cell wall biosynthesis
MYSSKGHGKEYVKNFCKGLKNNYDINLFFATTGDYEMEGDGFTITKIAVNYEKTNAEYFIKYRFLAPYIRAMVKQFRSWQYYRRIIKSEKISGSDIVFIMDYDVFPLYLFIKKLKKIKTQNYLWIHSAKFKSKDLLYSIYKSVFRYLFNHHIGPEIKKVIVNGDYIGKEIQSNLKLPNESFKVIQYPSEISYVKVEKPLARERLGFQMNERIVLFFGLLRKDKNVELLIESVAKSKHNIKLLIAGSEASVNESDVMRWLSVHNVDNYFLDIDYISEENMALYYSCSDVLMLTYDIESGSQSGPLSLAREFGLPALVSEVGEIGYYVKSNDIGLTATPNSQESFSSSLNDFFNMSTDELVVLSKNIDLAQKKFSWRAAHSKYIETFDEE